MPLIKNDAPLLAISNPAEGLVVPIPTLPADEIRKRSEYVEPV